MLITTAKEMYEIDHYTIQEIGMGPVLMENAGRAVCDKILQRIKKTDKIVVLVGGGHNGGDGFVVARTLHNLQYDVIVLQVVPDNKLVKETRHQKILFNNFDGRVKIVDFKFAVEINEATIIIDAITGLGIKGKLRSPLKEIVMEVNDSNAFVCSIDIPSGLPADEGITDFVAIRADMTIVIGAVKESTCIPTTSPYYGKWELVHIGHPNKAFSKIKRFVMGNERFKETIPIREPHSHKGTHGRGLLIGGNNFMSGAAVLAARASLKTGVGLLTVASTDRVTQHVANHCPEAMYIVLPEKDGELIRTDQLQIEGFNAIALGVGLGRRSHAGELVAAVIREANCPLIIDADGIYHLNSLLNDIKQRAHPTIITPHPGEMARLLDLDVQTLLAKPFYYSRKLAETYEIYVVLKGKETIITSPTGEQAVDFSGNPGLAKGGTGDVLTGIVLAMIMQDQSVFDALCNATFLHGTSADLKIIDSHTVYDLLATDVINGIPAAYRVLLGY